MALSCGTGKFHVSVSMFYFSVKNVSEFGGYLDLWCASAWNQQAKIKPNFVQFSPFYSDSGDNCGYCLVLLMHEEFSVFP